MSNQGTINIEEGLRRGNGTVTSVTSTSIHTSKFILQSIAFAVIVSVVTVRVYIETGTMLAERNSKHNHHLRNIMNANGNGNGNMNVVSELAPFLPPNADTSELTKHLTRPGTGREKKRDKSNIFLNTVNVNDPAIISPQGKRQDIPFFWVIPKSGTSTMRSLMTKCLHVRMASSSGLVKPNENIHALELVDLGKQGKFLNIDFSNPPGIKRAGELDMASSGLVDVAASSHVHPGAQIFTPQNPARFFTIIRHPITRMISAFHYSKIADWEPTFNSELKELTITEYALNPKYRVDNWMTRMLSDVHGEDLDDDDFDYAKLVLREKMFVLLLDDIEEGVDRLLTYLDWYGFLDDDDNNPEGGNTCLDAFLTETPANKNKHDTVEAGSVEWQMLEKINQYDLMLYWYAKDLYDTEQKDMVDTMKRNKLSRQQP